MGSPIVATHGKYGALYVLRPNGFSGIGLNDLTWGTGSTAADLTYYEVVIDGNAPDTYKWRVCGGGWTATVAFLGGVEETLADGQKLTFASQLGHTIGDQWVIGNLKSEPCDEATIYAQITDATARLLNPNAPPVCTDAGGKKVVEINYTNGTFTFSGNVGACTVTGNNGYVPTLALQKVGYLIDWSLSLNLDMVDSTSQGDAWKSGLPGQAGGSGSANAYFIANQTLLNCLQESIAAGDKYFLLQLFNYDPTQNQTGDHINAWVTFTSFAIGDTFSGVVKEAINFQIVGEISFVANA